MRCLWRYRRRGTCHRPEKPHVSSIPARPPLAKVIARFRFPAYVVLSGIDMDGDGVRVLGRRAGIGDVVPDANLGDDGACAFDFST